MHHIAEKVFALLFLVILLPVFILLFFVIRLTSSGSFLFLQVRAGKNKNPFLIYKIRTMVENAEYLKKNYRHLNQANGPVFKIKDDPRFTKVGKWLAHAGLDELPQLVNIVKGEMGFVGPRPLPIEEARKIPKKYQARFDVLPGITSPWVVNGNHKLSFKEWMELDIGYIKQKNTFRDITIAFQTIGLIFRNIFRKTRLKSKVISV